MESNMNSSGLRATRERFKLAESRFKRSLIVIMSVLICSVGLFLSTPREAEAADIVWVHMNGGDGLTFEFNFLKSDGITMNVVTIAGGKNVKSQTSLYNDETLINVYVYLGSDYDYWMANSGTVAKPSPIRIITPAEIGHRSDKVALLTNDGSMGATGTIITNSGDMNFWYRAGFNAASFSFYSEKDVVGQPLVAGAYNFKVYNQLGVEVASATNDAEGRIEFTPALDFNTPGTYVYTIKEIAPSPIPPGWTYDNNNNGQGYTVSLLVYYGTGAYANYLYVQPTYPNGQTIVFTNEFTPATIQLEASKSVRGRTLADSAGKFTFAVFEGSSQVATGTNDAHGNIVFSEIKYTGTGSHTYTIRETSTNGNGWTVDSTSHTVTVTVSANASGKLIAT
ncbi:MAG: hypothetical protein LBH87_00430, partial [Coriobacteriales bacterium]|nr:hypothetical protein [Coriobacteriales bacterium]